MVSSHGPPPQQDHKINILKIKVYFTNITRTRLFTSLFTCITECIGNRIDIQKTSRVI